MLNSKCGEDCMGKCFQNFGAALVPGNKADVEVYCKSRCVYMCDVVEDKSSPATKLIQTADPLNALSGRKRFPSAQLSPSHAFAPGSGACLKASPERTRLERQRARKSAFQVFESGLKIFVIKLKGG